jgi:hypothetical protein
MGDLQPVRPPSTLLSGHGVLIGGLVVVALLLAMLKPWGSADTGQAVEPTPTATPSPSPTPVPAAENGYSDLEYDPTIFGDTEPPAVWGLWPTGYLVTFGFVSQIPDDPIGSPAASPGDSGVVSSSAPTRTATLDGGPTWPARFDVPNGSHLLLVGVDMPRGINVSSASLQRVDPDGGLSVVPVERFPPPWPHFAVVGLPLRPGDRHLQVWPAGRYRLELAFDPGGIRRSMDIVIGPLPGGP